MLLQDPPEKQFRVSGGRRGSQLVRSSKRYGGQIAHFSRDKMSTAHHKCNRISIYWSQAMIRSIYHIGTVPTTSTRHRYCTRCTYARICSLRSLAGKRTAFHACSERQGHQGTYIPTLSHHADDPRHLRRVGKCDAVEQGSVSRRADYARASYQGRDYY